MKFYHKKDVTQEGTPILNGVCRRNTLMELEREIKSDQWHEMAVRTLSGGSSRQTDYGKCGSGSSAASTVPVGDCDVTSSWIYANRKDQNTLPPTCITRGDGTYFYRKNGVKSHCVMCEICLHLFHVERLLFRQLSRDQNHINKDAANEVFESHPNLDLQANSTSPSRRRCKICCRLTVSTIIALCIIGIFSSIGGIIYLEIFARPSLLDGSESSIKLSGHHYINGNPDWEYDDPSETTDEQDNEYSDVLDFKISTRATSPWPPRIGKVLQDEFPTPDTSRLFGYVNGTIHAVKNAIQMIKDANEQKNRRRLDFPENLEQQDNVRYDGGQSFLQKFTSFIFGNLRPIAPAKNDSFNIFKQNTPHLVSYIDKSLMGSTESSSNPVTPNVGQIEVGSGEIDEDTSAEVDLSVVVTPVLPTLNFPATLHAELRNEEAEIMEKKISTPSLEDFFEKFDNGLKVTTRRVDSITPPIRRKTTIATGGQSSPSVGASIEGLLKIFRAIGRIKTTTTPPPNDDFRENRQPGMAEGDTQMPNADSSLQERDQYLQRLRNIMLAANAIS